jgi:hypothetical protein
VIYPSRPMVHIKRQNERYCSSFDAAVSRCVFTGKDSCGQITAADCAYQVPDAWRHVQIRSPMIGAADDLDFPSDYLVYFAACWSKPLRAHVKRDIRRADWFVAYHCTCAFTA